MSAANVEEQADVARAVAEDCGGSDFAWSADEGERNRLWAARHSTYYASLALRNSNLQPDFNVRVVECFDTSTSTMLRELDESNRFVQKSAESTSI